LKYFTILKNEGYIDTKKKNPKKCMRCSAMIDEYKEICAIKIIQDVKINACEDYYYNRFKKCRKYIENDKRHCSLLYTFDIKDVKNETVILCESCKDEIKPYGYYKSERKSSKMEIVQ